VAATTRYRSGDVTVTLEGDLSAQLRALVASAMPGALAALEREGEKVAQAARAEWYGPRGVKRETGRGGDIEVVTTIDTGRAEVRVSVGSADTREDGRGKPIPLVQHSPSALSTEWVSVTPEEYWRTAKPLRGPWSIEQVKDKRKRAQFEGLMFPVIARVKEGAGRGHGYLMAPLVSTPMRRAISSPALLAEIGDILAGGKRG